MKTISNPFEFEAANNLKDEDIIKFYIEDHNYTRFIRSTKNIFIVGERGAGKTMTLLYNSFNIQYKIAQQNDSEINFDKIGIHVPCNTPLFHKKEYLLLKEEHKKYIICEHYLVLSILFNIAKTLSEIPEIKNDIKKIDSYSIQDLQYVWGTNHELRVEHFFNDIRTFVNKEIRDTQIKINTYGNDSFYETSYSFSSLLLPFFDLLKSIPSLKNSHFLIMVDDAHDMNEYQIRTLNSWIAYRDHSIFSFKIAIARIAELDRQTSSGGSILEGHDYLSIEMGKDLYNKDSDFYKFAKDIIETRLARIGIDIPVEKFFPCNSVFLKDIEESKCKARQLAETKYSDPKKITEYIKKYHRAIYFRERSPKANTPPYSGFETLVDISTGIIRNLLDPCYWMFDNIASEDNFNMCELNEISPAIQNSIIQQRSASLWTILREGLDKIIPNCSNKEGEHIYVMFDKIMILFKKRLLADISEPRAIVFTLTGEKKFPKEYEYIKKLLDISRKAQMLYTRISSGKQLGSKTVYYVPNRILLPDRGLDIKGQYSQVPISVKDLYQTITLNQDLPSFLDKKVDLEDDNGVQQLILDL